jgi:SAM-dependent methyltransferase
MAGYDLLARHYDAVTGDSASESAFIDSLIQPAGNHPVSLLEVACGTGNIIGRLANRHAVSGLDISPEMLAVAGAKLPAGTPLYLADMSSFELGERFDVLVCVYHGINHLLSFSAWKAFFACARRHLNDDGMLIFDILTTDELKMMARLPEVVQEFDDNYLLIRVRTSDDVVFEWNIEVLELQPSGRYESLTEVLRTASYSPEEIRQALAEEFLSVKIIESATSLNEVGGTRIWFVCTRPAPVAAGSGP